VVQPQPFDQRTERRREALDQNNRAPRADARVSLEHGEVADAKTDAAA